MDDINGCRLEFLQPGRAWQQLLMLPPRIPTHPTSPVRMCEKPDRVRESIPQRSVRSRVAAPVLCKPHNANPLPALFRRHLQYLTPGSNCAVVSYSLSWFCLDGPSYRTALRSRVGCGLLC